MLHKHEQYALDLVNTHGKEHATAIVQECLNDSLKRANELFLYDEVEWVFSHKTNTLNFPKDITKSRGKATAIRDRRIKENKNFYTAVMQQIKRMK